MRETAEQRRESDAVLNARARIRSVAESYGIRNPEYATALNQLALLLIMQGDPESAEPLLREALAIRRDAFGERHPDFATNLSSLGGLLWARGDFDEAEVLLRQAVDVRCDTLGPGHPKSVVSLNSLEQLIKAKRDWTRETAREETTRAQATAAPTPAAAAPEAARAVELRPGAGQIAARLESLSREFASLSESLGRAGEGLKSNGRPPDEELLTAWKIARDGFGALRGVVLDVAKTHLLSVPIEGLDTLDDLAALIPSIGAAESAHAKGETTRRGALAVVERVDRLTCPGDPEFAPLADCREQARALRNSIEAARSAELPDVAAALADRTHPLATMLDLVTADETVDDTTWAERYEAVDGALGHPLAVAIARGRILACGA